MSDFSTRILDWYAEHARRLPWRQPPGRQEHPDPYRVWVSEIMLQQTRVETVIPYFERWLELFPSVDALAQAAEQSVLSAWEGLGYYSRARNLQRAARMVVDEFGGEIPQEPDELRRLPGVGRYTAAAIASIAFNRNVATLDGNLRRVFARVFDVSLPAESPTGEQALWELAQAHLPAGRAGDYNQALMDLGATVCLPHNPLCLVCPVSEFCQARRLGIQEQRPVLKPKSAVPHKFKAAAVVVQGGRVLLCRRPSKGLLGGLWEFPAGEAEADTPEALSAAIATGYHLELKTLVHLGELKHAYTHFKLTESAWRCELVGDAGVLAACPFPIEWVRLEDLEHYPMGKVDRAITKLLRD